MFRLSAPARKWLVLTHIVSVALWFGVDIGLGILVLTARTADDPQVAGLALQAIPMFAIWPMFGASLASLITGAVLGLGTSYGLFKRWWVVIKLVVNLGMSTLILFLLRPAMDGAAAIGRRLVQGEAVEVSAHLLGPVFVAPTLLLLAFVLSVFKPRWRIR